MTPRQKKKAKAKRCEHQRIKTMNRVRRVHYAFATIIKSNWSYRELLQGIVQRLADKDLSFICKSNYYNELIPFAVDELAERQLFNKGRITSDDEIISKVKVPKVSTQLL